MSAPRVSIHLVSFLAVVVAVVAVIAFSLLGRDSSHQSIQLGRQSFELEVVSTPSALQRGLSGRSSMASDQGMLFVFPELKVQCMWMKDMRFSLDMVWLDNNRRVIHMMTDVSPESFPKSFCSEQPARYVIELNAGQLTAADVRSGQQLSF